MRKVRCATDLAPVKGSGPLLNGRPVLPTITKMAIPPPIAATGSPRSQVCGAQEQQFAAALLPASLFAGILDRTASLLPAT